MKYDEEFKAMEAKNTSADIVGPIKDMVSTSGNLWWWW